MRDTAARTRLCARWRSLEAQKVRQRKKEREPRWPESDLLKDARQAC